MVFPAKQNPVYRIIDYHLVMCIPFQVSAGRDEHSDTYWGSKFVFGSIAIIKDGVKISVSVKYTMDRKLIQIIQYKTIFRMKNLILLELHYIRFKYVYFCFVLKTRQETRCLQVSKERIRRYWVSPIFLQFLNSYGYINLLSILKCMQNTGSYLV